MSAISEEKIESCIRGWREAIEKAIDRSYFGDLYLVPPNLQDKAGGIILLRVGSPEQFRLRYTCMTRA